MNISRKFLTFCSEREATDGLGADASTLVVAYINCVTIRCQCPYVALDSCL